jgi:Ca-activated chloride channel family protein
MFEFHWPWAAILLPLPLLLPYLWPRPATHAEDQLEGQRHTLLHPRLDALQEAYQTRRLRRQLGGWVY